MYDPDVFVAYICRKDGISPVAYPVESTNKDSGESFLHPHSVPNKSSLEFALGQMYNKCLTCARYVLGSPPCSMRS